MSDVAVKFLHLESDDHSVLSEVSLSLSPSDVVHVIADLSVRDSLGRVHFYHPSCDTTVQNIITDIQNCPFVQIPLRLKNRDSEVDPSLPVWNLLSPSMDEIDLHMAEVGIAKGCEE